MQTLSFQRNYSRTIRLWHWCSFLVVTLLLLTVFAGKFFLNPFANSFRIKDYLDKQRSPISMQQAFGAAAILSERIWKAHIFLGCVLAGLFVFRLLIEFFQPKEQTILFRLRNAWQSLTPARKGKIAIHYLFIQIIHLAFYLLTAVLVVTGLWLAFRRAMPASRELSEQIHQIKELHQQCFIGLLFYIFIHLAGVIRTERREHKSLVSSMIHGGSKPPENRTAEQTEKVLNVF
jgi:Ni/Fe-hydrogenase 1 B-type cytochrome subunit